MAKKNNDLWFPPLSTYKSYIECLSELDGNDVLLGLIGYGLVAEPIPPIIYSLSFSQYCLQNNPKFKTTKADYIRYEGNRHNHKVRLFGIPNPFAYFHLCQCISISWERMLRYFEFVTNNQNYKISRLHIRKQKNNPAIFKMNYKWWKTDETPEIDLKIGARFVAQADISVCFPSMYTHVIPWAVTGKSVAKKYPKFGWPNRLDKFLRQTTNNETHGILIGPHASNIVSEIILLKVDKVLYDKGFSFIRNIDDYSCFSEDYDSAEDFIFVLRKTLREFGLRLNDSKTKIVELPQNYQDNWVNRLNYEKPIPINGKVNFNQVQMFLDLVKVMMIESNDNLAILKYLLKSLKDDLLTDNAAVLYQKFFLKMGILFPYLLSSFEEYLFEPFNVDPLIIKDWCNVIYSSYEKRGNQEAIAYMFYFALKYDFRIENATITSLLESTDCVVKTLGAVYFTKNKDPRIGEIYKDALSLYQDKSVRDQFWLYCYTILDEKHLDGDWKKIKRAGVTFIDESIYV